MQALAKIILHHLSHVSAVPTVQMGSPSFSEGYTHQLSLCALNWRQCKAIHIILAEEEIKQSWIDLHITSQAEGRLR